MQNDSSAQIEIELLDSETKNDSDEQSEDSEDSCVRGENDTPVLVDPDD